MRSATLAMSGYQSSGLLVHDRWHHVHACGPWVYFVPHEFRAMLYLLALRCLERVISRRSVQLLMPADVSEAPAEEVERVQVGTESLCYVRLVGVGVGVFAWPHMHV